MKNEPKPELPNNPENVEGGISFTEQLHLAQEMLSFANERDTFARNMGGGDFEGFATVGQHLGDNRAKYDALVSKFAECKMAFDKAVPDKRAFVKKLRSMNENDLANTVARMFGVREGIFGKFFKK